ncbi:UNVERIFIED_CONTAM: hypothetical protein FKN15_061158 [Acipenser sinensis]
MCCYRCGQRGHSGRACEIAREKQCHSCGKEGHFAVACRTKNKFKVNQVTSEPVLPTYAADTDDEYVFTLTSVSDNGEMKMLINEEPVNMLIDLVGTAVWNHLQAKCNMQLIPTTKKLYAYGSKQPLAIDVFFTAAIKAPGT